jgi:hypothetical protein
VAGIVGHACDLSTREAAAGGSKFPATLSSIGRPCQKRRKEGRMNE